MLNSKHWLQSKTIFKQRIYVIIVILFVYLQLCKLCRCSFGKHVHKKNHQTTTTTTTKKKNAFRIVFNKEKFEHTRHLFKSNKLLNIINTSSGLDYVKPIPKLRVSQYRISITGTYLWNNFLTPRKFYIRRNNNKVDSIEKERIVLLI